MALKARTVFVRQRPGHDTVDRMAVPVVGRDAELRALHRVLDRSGGIDGAVAIALDGEAGIGKSTLWRAVVEAARERGLRVLCARCAQPEAGLA